MAVYAISDLHLSFAKPKPMDIFGDVWREHPEKIRRNWDELVREEDIVLLPGDLSWGLRLPEARPDLDFIADRPGRKVLIRGNHDYWWQRRSTSRIQRIINRNMTFLQGTSVLMDDIGITGTRGWRLDWETRAELHVQNRPHSHQPTDEPPDYDPLSVEASKRIMDRELDYLDRGLRSIPESARLKIAMLHFPPFDERLQPNEFAELLEKYSVDFLVYGHVHLGLGNWLDGMVGEVEYRMVSADVVDFTPQLIVD